MKNKPILKLTLLLGSMLTMLANAIIAPALPVINEVFTNVPNAEFLTKLMMTLPALTIAIFAPFAGGLVDKIGRMKILISSLIIYAIAGSSGFWLNNLYILLVGRFFLGLGVAGIMTSVTTLIGDYFVGEERNKFLSLQSSFIALGGLFFITTSGFLADINWHLPFIIYSFSLIVLVLAPIYLFEPDKVEKTSNAENKSKVPPIIWLIFGSAFVGILFFYIVPVQVPFYLKTFKGVTNSMTGLAIGCLTLSQAVSAFFYKNLKRHFSFQIIYAMSFIVMSIGFLFVGLSSSYIQVILSILVLGIGTGWLFPNANLWIISISNNSNRGKYIGFLSTFTFLGMFVSPIFIQPIQSWFDIKFSFVVSAGILFILAIIYAIVFMPRNKKAK